MNNTWNDRKHPEPILSRRERLGLILLVLGLAVGVLTPWDAFLPWAVR